VQQLENVRAEEALMVGAETLEIAARIDQNVIDMGANVAGINEGVQGVHDTMAGMTGQLQSAHVDVQGVGHEVHSIHAGDLLFSSLAPECVLSFTRPGVTEAKGDIQVVLKYVSDLNRS
jgi:hypothetical protein